MELQGHNIDGHEAVVINPDLTWLTGTIMQDAFLRILTPQGKGECRLFRVWMCTGVIWTFLFSKNFVYYVFLRSFGDLFGTFLPHIS